MESRIPLLFSVKVCLDDSVPYLYSQISPNPAFIFLENSMSIKSSIGSSTVLFKSKHGILHLELFFFYYHFNAVFHGFLIAWSACYFCFVLEHKWKELLIRHGI